ncbi:MAG: malectin domain-containing carbohydrate-binding protein [Mangrovibacterium sp.]
MLFFPVLSWTRNIRRLLLPGLLMGIVLACSSPEEQAGVRRERLLNKGWLTVVADSVDQAFREFPKSTFCTEDWIRVDVPHNWDDYGGYRRLIHGNRHGCAWYRKSFTVENYRQDKRYLIWFEGVGSYATVWLNGDSVGYHAGGRTSFTLDVTGQIRGDGDNLLAVRADHPAGIRNLPWVCGGCSPEWGFSEGSQPMGIFRPVHLIETDPLRIVPFGVHIWNDENISAEEASLHLTTEVCNDYPEAVELRVVNELLDACGKRVDRVEQELNLQPGQLDTVRQQFLSLKHPRLWSVEDPYRYTVRSRIYRDEQLADELNTSYGIRWIKWDISGENPTNRFYLNGKPVFINGTAEYEHQIGQSHAFSEEQIQARVSQFLAAGYNSFRDAHQPHNLRYQEAWDSHGILWWPQMAAHIWFDNPEFKKNFKQLLTDWIRERRNSPSVILWGLENESSLPAGFAGECSDLIRRLDPTASSQRLITTCNGGTGTDWNVIQNWSGTYGGDPEKYGEEISRQLLNGEYGAWRTVDFHTEGGFEQNGSYSEERFCLLMESKIRLAESVRNRCCGQYHWLLFSHENPGRTQSGEGLRDLDRLGPVNYKGIMSIWGEPLDAWYMYRANYVPKESEPMVYLVSHSWPDRWTEPGIKNGISVFSNCEEVELFNGVKKRSLGRQSNPGRGYHFVWDGVDVQTDILYAVGYVKDKAVAEDYIRLHHLPESEGIETLAGKITPLTETRGKNYLYRVNCGGPDYTDREGDLWMADVRRISEDSWGSSSWTDGYEGLPAFYGSQRQISDPVQGTLDWPLLQTFRYGRHKLAWEFPVPDGEYEVELFFLEPWYGTGGGLDCSGWRLFDVALNGQTVLEKLDIWKEAGHDRMLKKRFRVKVCGGLLRISFPRVEAGQAVISAIAISSGDQEIKAAPASPRLIIGKPGKKLKVHTWLSTGDRCFPGAEERFSDLPAELYGAEWLNSTACDFGREALASLRLSAAADVYVALDDSVAAPEGYQYAGNKLQTGSEGRTSLYLYRKQVAQGISLADPALDSLSMRLLAAVPVSRLDDPIDLRKSVSYTADKARVSGKGRKTELAGKKAVLLSGNGDAVSWDFSVGLASKYGLEIRYLNPGSESLMMDMSITSLDGRLMWKGPLQFIPTGKKWKSLRTDTRTTINAGTYTLQLRMLHNRSAAFTMIKIQ